MILSDEQQYMIDMALKGHNILVDACIGSGKTTTIQQLCLKIPKNKVIVYLTYNRLLKEDAQEKILKQLKYNRGSSNFEITNYNGFAYKYLKKVGIVSSVQDQIYEFNKIKPKIIKPDVLIIDEYQDIKEDHAEMLKYIKSINPKMQIIMVGDMAQKIYDNTELDVLTFVNQFMIEYKEIKFTKSFRINKELGTYLGDIWGKEINGVNNSCLNRFLSFDEFLSVVKNLNTSEILCLGSKTGLIAQGLNILESLYPNKFNKKTVYASISDRDANIKVDKNTAIFTTFDSSKGLERDYCFVFDWDQNYWGLRINQTNVNYEIIRNLFCVAASRGKKAIYFITNQDEFNLMKNLLKTKVETKYNFTRPINISEMFEYKIEAHLREAFDLLTVCEKRKKDKSSINIKTTDEKIDLSPCIGKYSEACFFKNFHISEEYKLYNIVNSGKGSLSFSQVKNKSLDEQICTLIAAETRQDRYKTQVEYPIVSDSDKEKLVKRLKTVFNSSEKVQEHCEIDLQFVKAVGFADVVKNDIVYELKFVSELKLNHYLQCAMYMIGLNKSVGRLWNIRTNEVYEIRIKDRDLFLEAVKKIITKGKG